MSYDTGMSRYYQTAVLHWALQVLPQLLHHMDLDAEDPESPDWGCIAVYSCPKSCSSFVDTDKSAYTEEFVWVQMP